jgi:hypothetical protein
MERAVKMAEMSSEGRGRRRRQRRRGGLPHRWHHGGAPPLSPLPSWLHGSPPPWRWDPWGRRKHGSVGCKFVGGGVPHELGFLALYSLSDSRLPILGRTRSGLTRPFGLGIRWSLCPKCLTWNFLQLCSSRVFCLTMSLTLTWPSSKRVLALESPNLTPTRFPLVFSVIPTHQSVKQEHCVLLQLLVG